MALAVSLMCFQYAFYVKVRAFSQFGAKQLSKAEAFSGIHVARGGVFDVRKLLEANGDLCAHQGVVSVAISTVACRVVLRCSR